MKKKKYNDELIYSTSDSKMFKQNENLIKEVESLSLDVPDEIMQRIENDVEQSEKQPKISMGGLNEALEQGTDEYCSRV